MLKQHEARIIPLSKWEQFHPWPTTAGLRHLVFHAGNNGFRSRGSRPVRSPQFLARRSQLCVLRTAT